MRLIPHRLLLLARRVQSSQQIPPCALLLCRKGQHHWVFGVIARSAPRQSFTFASPGFTPLPSTTRSLSPRPWLTPTSRIFTTCPSFLKVLTSCSSSVPSSRMHTSTLMLAMSGSSPGAVVDSILSPRFTGVNLLILSHLIRLSGSGPPNVLQRPNPLPVCFSWTGSILETCFNRNIWTLKADTTVFYALLNLLRPLAPALSQNFSSTIASAKLNFHNPFFMEAYIIVP